MDNTTKNNTVLRELSKHGKNLRPDFIEQCQCCLKRSAHGESAALRSEAISSMMEAVAGCTISRGMLYSIQNHQAIFRDRLWKNHNLLGASEVSANLYCNSRTSVLERLRDYLRLLMGRTLRSMDMVTQLGHIRLYAIHAAMPGVYKRYYA